MYPPLAELFLLKYVKIKKEKSLLEKKTEKDNL